MTRSISSAMEREICESADVVSRIVRYRHTVAEVARRLDIGAAPLVVMCSRGSSGKAGFSYAASSKPDFICRCPPVLHR